jgi:hypothetical protein
MPAVRAVGFPIRLIHKFFSFFTSSKPEFRGELVHFFFIRLKYIGPKLLFPASPPRAQVQTETQEPTDDFPPTFIASQAVRLDYRNARGHASSRAGGQEQKRAALPAHRHLPGVPEHQLRQGVGA